MGTSCAVVLAAGSGKRMNSATAKQYLPLAGKPVLYYALRAFEESEVSEIVLVVAPGECEQARTLLAPYSFSKLKRIVEGGAERFHSVYHGLCAASADTEYVLIHDGARPLVTPRMIAALLAGARERGSAVAACPLTDTVKVIDEKKRVCSTPDRSTLWKVQTPQVFLLSVVKKAYEKMLADGGFATDDAAVVERYTDGEIYLVDCGYRNIKITTPEDLLLAEILLEK